MLTLLEDEEGAERVEGLLREAENEVLLPLLVLLETYYITVQEQSEAVADGGTRCLSSSP